MNKHPEDAIELTKAMQQLIEQVRLSDAPQEVLQEATAKVHELTQLLQPHQSQGTPCAAMLDGDLDNYPENAKSPQEIMPYSPIIGTLNPVSPGFEFHYIEDRVEGAGIFPVTFTGPPNTVHGGLVAAAFDEILTAVVLGNGPVAFTGTLNIRYVNRTVVGKEVLLTAEIHKREGRKIFTRAEMHQGEKLTATAEAVFIEA